MKRQQTASGMSLMLIELVIAIGFFAVAAAICVRIFVGASLSATGSYELNRAVIAAESAAECFKAAGGDADEAAQLFEAELENSGFLLYYNSEWERAADGEGAYLLRLSVTEEDSLSYGHIYVANLEGEEIYTLEVAVAKGVPS